MSNHFYFLKTVSVKTFQLLVAVLLVLAFSGKSRAQSRTFTYEIKNDSIIDCNHFRFSIWIKATTGLDSLRNAQVCLWLSKAFVNGTVDSIYYVAGSSDISATNIFGTPSIVNPTAGGSPPGTGGDSLVVRMNSSSILCPGYIMGTTQVRWAEFEIARSGAGCWGAASNKMSFYKGFAGGQKVQTNMTFWVSCPSSSITPQASNGTYIQTLDDQTPTITSNPADTSVNTCGSTATFCVTATLSGANPGSTNTITYQWKENGVPLTNVAPYSGVTTSCLTITHPSLSLDSNYYSCTVKQGASVISDSALLKIINTGSTSSSSNVIVCDIYVWNGGTYTTAGDKTFNASPNSIGCDSLAILHLTINKSSTSSSNQTACVSFVWNGGTYTTSGAKTYQTTNAAGCDSTATLHLTVGIPAPVITADAGALITSCTTGGCTYTWYYGVDSTSMSPLPSSNNDTLYPVSNGYYYVTITDANTCTNSSAKYLLLTIGLGSQSIGSLISVYPNPTEGNTNIKIESETAGDYILKVLDLTGRELKTLAFKTKQGSNLVVLDMKGYAKGVYMLSLQTGHAKQLTRLIVE